MPLIPCPICKQEISDDAVACPKCGHPMKKGTGIGQTSPSVLTIVLKVIVSILGLIVFVVFLFGLLAFMGVKFVKHDFEGRAEKQKAVELAAIQAAATEVPGSVFDLGVINAPYSSKTQPAPVFTGRFFLQSAKGNIGLEKEIQSKLPDIRATIVHFFGSRTIFEQLKDQNYKDELRMEINRRLKSGQIDSITVFE